MQDVRGLQWAGVVLCVVALCSLACGGMKFGFQPGDIPAENTSSQPAPRNQNATTSGESASSETSLAANETSATKDEEPITLLPSPEALRRAGASQIPPVEAGQPLAGPFDGPQATLVYANRSGEVTLYHPEAAVAYFATGNGFAWNYMITHEGYFEFQSGAQPLRLEKPPQELTSWPRAIPVAKTIASIAGELVELEESDGAAARARREELLERQEAIWAVLANMDERIGATVDVLVTRIGAPDCAEKREGEVLIGCY